MNNSSETSAGGSALWLVGACLLALQWMFIRFFCPPLSAEWTALAAGMAIVGAAFLLSWAAELFQLDVAQSFALLVLAFIAVLPEYAVDLYLAWNAGKDPQYICFATANMTGANRLLIGLGWPAVLFGYWLGTRKTSIEVDPSRRLELKVLIIATIYSFVIPIKGTLSLMDTIFLFGFFGYYITSAIRSRKIEPELEGPADLIARAPATIRRVITAGMFVFAAGTIIIAVEPFTEGLLEMGRSHNIEEFILIQWVAPLASESPEFIVAILFALRGNASMGFGTLLSSKVNQWTLLVGALPLTYMISLGRIYPMHLTFRQSEEILLTSAQSIFGAFILVSLVFCAKEAIILAALFVTQLMIPIPIVRFAYSGLYILLSIGWLFKRGEITALRDTFRKQS